MVRLTLFELSKVWRRRAFILSALALLAVNVFILWYSSLGSASAPGLSAYKRLRDDISGMSKEEKHAYVGRLRETIDGVSFVENILLLRSSGMGEQFAELELEENPGVFEKYYDLYTSGGYLRYTDSLAAEKAFIDKIYGEERKVYGYGSYLQEVREREDLLGGISIFGNAQNEDSFSSRNIKKSAADHAALTTEGVGWSPSAPITAAAQNMWSDILLVALSFLFVTGLVTDEKLKGLSAITRAARRGVVPTIAAKLTALLVYCFVTETVFFASNVLFSGVTAGWWDLNVRLQSVSAYMESSLDITVWEFYALSVVTKSLTMFAAFALIAALCVAAKNVTVPYFGGTVLWVSSWALWRFVPAASAASPAKHLNLFALLRTENIFGAYLNLDVGGKPFSRMALSLGLAAVIALAGVVLSVLLYRRPMGQTTARGLHPRPLPFRPHASLLRHEAYKLLVTNHGLAILLAFSCLIAAQSLSNAYSPSSAEQYYQNIMLSLEGELTQEKEELIASETARFDEAFEEIRQIDAAVASGEISEDVGDTLKARWQAVTAFYPAFERVLDQYELVRDGRGSFIYDTGWLYLLGTLGTSELSGFLLLTLGLILALSNAGAMEFSSGAWSVLNATKAGGRGVLRRKLAVCALAGALFAAVPFLFRAVSTVRAFPIHGHFTPARMLPLYRELPAAVPTLALGAAKLTLQMLCGAVMALAVSALSFWRRSHIQTVFLAFLILAAPCVLSTLGFGLAEKISLYPVYAWTLT